ncbi:MAG TPA: tetratricopeptide repeat protein, partial [Planctomycetia bacterium]|nr:tetratricopeptide repeat protein [Planctomycetia bacterium]
PGHERFPGSVAKLAAIYHDQILAAKTDKLPDAGRLADGVAELRDRIAALDKKPGTGPEFKRDRAIAVWVLARMAALASPDKLDEPIRLIKNEVLVENSLSAPVRLRAAQYALQWELKSGRAADAAKTVRDRFTSDSTALATTLALHSPLEEGLTGAQRTARVAAIEAASEVWLSRSDELSAKVKADLRLMTAEAFSAKGDSPSALRLLRRMRDESPRDARVVRTLARISFANGQIAEARTQWESLLAGMRPGGEEWLQAVIGACRCYLKTNDFAKAAKILEYVEKRYPKAGAEETRAEIARIREQVRKGGK